MVHNAVVVACSCGRVYTKDEWARLPLAGIQYLSWGEVLELRNCSCTSTIAMQIEAGESEAGMEAE